MQLPTDDTVHPHFIPITERFRRQDVNTILDARVLCILTCALGLHGRTDGFDDCLVCSGGVCDLVKELKIGDPGVVLDHLAVVVEFPERDLKVCRQFQRIHRVFDGAAYLLEGSDFLTIVRCPRIND